MSLCRNRNLDFEDNINDNQYPRKNIEDIRTNPMDLSKGSIRRTKKNKTRMPKEFVFNEEDEKILKEIKQKESVLDFEDSDDEKKGKKKYKRESDKKIKVEIINTDMPKKEEKENDENKIEHYEEKKEELININKEENNKEN